MLKRKSHARAVGTGSLNKGRCAWDDAIGLRRELEQLGDGGFVATFKLTTAAQLRSEKANAYYFGHVLERVHAFCPEHSVDEIHDAMCALFLPNERKRALFVSRMTGEELYLDVDDKRRSSKLDGKDFYHFVEKVRLWALEFYGCETYDPDPEWKRWAA